MADEIEKLGQYFLMEKLAQGGMAQVFKARTVDTNGFQRLTVIKRILPHISADPEYVDMLVEEAKIAVHFTHGNIAQVYDLGRVNNDYFIVMEYVDGKTFSQINKKIIARREKIPLDIYLYCFIEVCHGLSYVHNKKGPDDVPLGVVHRDISPQNIMLSYAGNIKIIDFGVAKAEYREGKTESGVLKGKFAYMSPEQARGSKIDSRSDIFSIGVLLWEMATGERLFKRKTHQETIQAIQKTKFESASELRPDLPRELDKIIRKALQKNPRSRYQDAADMAHDLERLLFKVNPDFKSIQAAEFIYKLFGPEEDEKDLPDQVFEKEKTPTPKTKKTSRLDGGTSDSMHEKKASYADELTQKEYLDHATPIVKISPSRALNLSYSWLIALLMIIFVSGSLYVYHLHNTEYGYLILKGLDSEMKIFIDDEEFKPILGKIELPSNQSYILNVKKKEYHDFTKQVNLTKDETVTIDVSLNPTALLLTDLTIKTIPAGATLYFDNVEWQEKTPVVIRNLEVDSVHQIGLYLEKYQFHAEDITVERGKPMELNYFFQVEHADE